MYICINDEDDMELFLSYSFPLLQVKQEAVLSQISFAIHIESLLERLKLSDIGCYVGRTYAGAFGSANDVPLLLPHLSGLKHMCEYYAEDHHILFNPIKSKLLCYDLLYDAIPNVTLCGTIADAINQ